MRAEDTLGQWQLIRLRFCRHALAVTSLGLLGILYCLALFADFFAPNAPDKMHLEHTYGPPSSLHWNFADGLHTYAVEQSIDPVTLRRNYRENTGCKIPLRFLVPEENLAVWGKWKINCRFFGPDCSKLSPADHSKAEFFLFGADRYGRDIFSRILHGSRVSLSIGLVSVVFTLVLGCSIGALSGYLGGATDNFIQRGIEITQSFPQLPLWLAFGAALPADWPQLQTYFAITIVLSLLNWTGLARVVRGKILALREEDYAMAARLLGASHGRILFCHLLPGFTSHIVVSVTLAIPGMILGETTLSFLGLGLRAPVVSWGVMLQDCLQIQSIANYPWLLMPVVFITITVLAFHFLGDGLRDAADPYARK